MSPQEPTPQDDDQTPVKPWDIPFDELTEGQVITVALKGSAKRYRVKSVTHEGNTWTASVVPADLDDPEAVYWPISAEPTTEPKFDATVLSETAAAAAERRIMAGQVTTFSKTIHHTPEGWSHVVGGESTHQDDDCTQIVHDVMNTLDGALHHDIDCRDVQTILNALKTLGYELVNQVGTVQGDQWTDIPAHGLLRAGQQNNVAAVVLPEPDEHGCWYIDGTNDWLVHTGENGKRVFFETSVDLYEFAPDHAGNVAAALLAAKAKVEASE